MKQWYCSVCGYTHWGEEPLKVCPICSASQDDFIEKNTAAEPSIQEKKWICTVCGYIHSGKEPVDICPICGAVKALFKEYIPETKSTEMTEKEWKDEVSVDIIVVGSGGGALAAAVTALSLGQTVVVLEKAETLGGTTRRSGGRYWIPNNYLQKEIGIVDNKEDAIAYMARYSFPGTYNESLPLKGLSQYAFEMIENYYENASVMLDYFRELGVFESAVDYSWTGNPHVDYMQNLPENKDIRGRSIYPLVEAGPAASGNDLIELFIQWLKNKNADIRTEHRVLKALTNGGGEVTGVTSESPTHMQNFYAKKGVIFGTGGFSQNLELLSRFHAYPLIGGCAVPTNTGDLIGISEELGVMLGNMTNAFRAQSMYEEYLKNPEGSNSTFYFVGDSFLEVNKYGKRVVNEKRNYNDRTQIHNVWDPVRAEYPNQFLFFIMDQRILDYWPGFPPYPMASPQETEYLIMGKDFPDLAKQIQSRLEKIKDHIGSFALEDSFTNNLIETVNRFNEFAKNGKDLDFGRGETTYDRDYASLPPFKPDVQWPSADQKSGSMYPLAETGPYYAIILAPGSLDTNGGPMTNKQGQFLKENYKPVEGIYGAGNCIAAPSKGAYWGAGATIGPAMTYGYLGAKHASTSKDKEKQ